LIGRFELFAQNSRDSSNSAGVICKKYLNLSKCCRGFISLDFGHSPSRQLLWQKKTLRDCRGISEEIKKFVRIWRNNRNTGKEQQEKEEGY
jgi:hypothetical protein